MKFFSVPALLAAALFSVVVVLPFLPAAKLRPDFFALEVRASSTVSGRLQVFYDDGAGLSEAKSTTVRIVAGPAPQTYRLPLPPGRYVLLRLDPIDRSGRVKIDAVRVVAQSGRVLRELPLRDFSPANQVEHYTLRADGGAEVAVAPGALDPQLIASLTPPLEIRPTTADLFSGLPQRAGTVLALLALGLFALERARGLRTRLARGAGWLAARPARAVGGAAALAVIASAYPVVFLGQSHVSPNLGTALLYDGFPTLPGYDSAETTDVKLADIGAVMWAHLPYSIVQHRALAHGELPLWNRYNSAGTPLLAQGQSMFGDPLHLVVILADGAAWAWDLKYLVAKWLWATGLALIVLRLAPGTRSAGTAEPAGPARILPAALLVAIAAPFVGFFVYRVNHPAYFSLCYAPWPLLCLIGAAQAATRRATALWTAGLVLANLALMNSGTVKEAYMLLLCVNFSGACVLLAAAASWRERLGKLAVLAGGGVIFVLLTAPVWATFLTTLNAAYTGYNAASAYQIQPTLLLGFFDEIFYRPIMPENRVFSPSLNFLLLAGVLYFGATLRLHFAHRGATALAASALLPLSLAFGLVPPSWIERLPFLANVAHIDNTFSCALLVLGSVLAGLGFAAALARLGTREGRGDLAVAGLLLFALVFAWIAFRQVVHRPILGLTFTVNQPGQAIAVHPFIWGYLAALLAAIAGLALVARSGCTRGWTVARVLALAACAAVMLERQALHAMSAGFEEFLVRPTVRVDFHAKSQAVEFVRAAVRREPARSYGLNSNLFPGWSAVYGLETVHGPDALVNPWLRELVSVSGVNRIWDWRLYHTPQDVGAAQAFFDALNVRYYFDLLSDQGLLGRTLQLRQTADLDVYESATAWPRAFFTDRLAAYDQPAEVVALFRQARGRPLAAAWRNDLAGNSALAGLPRELEGRTTIAASDYRLTENTTSFTVRASGPGVIVLTEVLWPRDFRVEVNGVKQPVLRLNHAFKGVAVDAAGEYRVTFRYVPRNWPRNLMLCGLGAVLAAGALFFVGRGTRAA